MDNIIYFIKSTLTNEMASSGFPLIYKGEMSHQIMRSFAYMANRKIAKKNIPTPIRKRAFHIIVECLQNITKHSDDYDDKEKQIGNGLFIIGWEKEVFYVVTGNLVRNEKIKPLEERLAMLNRATPSELKALYMKQMVEGSLNDKGGAGLGLIDISRKSGRKLFYYFAPFDKHHHFFLLTVTISTNMPVDKDDMDEEG
ncbi:MAG TPA: SiaB family protein kinase [Tenuifilaceae bacterium]|nr:SiaB family protein kinase [Bacteroidales bacterium]OQC63670.1 MAG: hypothetical protein BWX49_01165 [Bacteroidetes bacterium ADurb.Bin008]HPI70256.1 SiaB family protein kinase [Tenuifilaceae bacterium]HPX08052.1 SiaB family protein kinase [Tenuifilaceae bacterium]HQC66142.1 SiaB family protein kinase [Tenuifilaceae bacterium]